MAPKPTIFFSHSSHDSQVVGRIKQKFVEKTHGTIDVFVSSDGQSIRLGKNWVHEIEEALERASIMFVFLTPDSTKSGWIYFESGYCHSKGIEVIPIALNGVDLNSVRPPLSLLQGFNLISAGSLNNLISTANQKFGTSHPESFTDEDYSALVTLDQTSSGSFAKVAEKIAKVDLYLSARKELDPKILAQSFRDRLREVDSFSLAELSENDVNFLGGSASFSTWVGKTDNVRGVSINIKSDIQNLEAIEKAIDEIAQNFSPESASLYITLDRDYRVITESTRFSALLRQTETTISDRCGGNDLEYRNLVFSVFQSSDHLVLEFVDPAFAISASELLSFLQILIERGIIFKAELREMVHSA